jgi:hypothetical protein
MLIQVSVKSSKAVPGQQAIQVKPTKVVIPSRAGRVLDFDIENRPLSYLGQDFTTAEVTAIAWAWTDSPEAITCYLLGESDLVAMLDMFCHVWQQADMVTGHFIIGHDLPMLNGALMECHMPPLPDKMVQDTKVHLIRSKGLSLSQENLGAMFRLDNKKVGMNQVKWRAANRLTPEGLDDVRQRVIGDVRQHIALRNELLTSGYLAPPRMWSGGSAPIVAYTP